MNFVLVFVLVFKRAFNALFSNDRNHQIIHERFRFIFIFNRRNDVNFIFRFNVLSFRFFRNLDRDVNFFFEKFILDFDTFCFENIKQFLVLDLNEIESSFCCFHSFFKLNQKISKSSHFRVDDVRLMMCDIINCNNYVANAILLFDFFAHANDTTSIFCQRIQKNVVIIFFFDNY